jgi:hypothetical protein
LRLLSYPLSCPPAYRVSFTLRLGESLCNYGGCDAPEGVSNCAAGGRVLAHSIRLRHRERVDKFPTTLTNIELSARIERVFPKSGPVAQLGARFHGMEEVIGSIPIRSTKFLNNLRVLPRILNGPERSNKKVASLSTDLLFQHPCHPRLRLTHGRGHRLRVNLERHPDGGVA